MIVGIVDGDGVPTINLEIEGKSYSTIVDTGFNGGLEFPMTMKASLNPRPIGARWAELAAGQRVREQLFRVSIPFDGRVVSAEASFVTGSEQILLGTALLKEYRLEIDFPQSKVVLQRVVESNGSS